MVNNDFLEGVIWEKFCHFKNYSSEKYANILFENDAANECFKD